MEKKSFSISKQVVWEAHKYVRSNQGAAGVDSQSVEDFEKNRDGNLYKIWNRMSSGTYFPPPVRAVAIPKDDGKERVLGIPTVSDRIAQTVVKMYLEPLVEPRFHSDSYGYRPNKSAHDAVSTARERCWQHYYVIDLDIKGFFDNLDHHLVMKTVKKFTWERWILLYIERWLKAPAQLADGTLVTRNKGTPQGGVISPLLANIFLHFAFDRWMKENFPNLPFERYADDVIVHCRSEKQATHVKSCIRKRLANWKLELHPEKTTIVYCKDDNRKGSYPNEKFDFLGFTFRPRHSDNKWGGLFVSFRPAVSNKAKKAIYKEMRHWGIKRRSDKGLNDIARMFNPKLLGWINYYGKFCKSALYKLFNHYNESLVRWATWKYKRFLGSRRRARRWLGQIAEREPSLFPHWRLLGIKPSVG
jgi:RNA-directed DNA polymerase